MITRSEQCEAIFGALAKAQAEIGVAVFDSVNPHFRSKYASLSAVREVVKEPFAKNGLSVSQWLDGEGDGISLTTILTHSSGQYIQSSFPLLLPKRDMQGLGSATTYARRYALAALAGVVSDEDDDGNAATVTPKSQPYQPRVSAPAPQAQQMPDDFLNDGSSSDIGDYVVQIGKKFKGKKISEIPLNDLKNYYDYFAAQKSEGKKIADNVVDLLSAIETYISKMEVAS